MILAYTCERSILCIYCLCFPPFQILTLLTDFHETSNEHYATGIYSQACLKFPLLINNKVVVTNFYVGLYYTGKTYILYIYIYIYIYLHNNPPVGQGLLIREVSGSHTTTHHSR